MRTYYVYIMASRSKTLYIGMTSDLQRRVYEHKTKRFPGFTARYNITRLVYYEATNNVHVAIEREKQLKGWLRRKKVALIETANPNWTDLSVAWHNQSMPNARDFTDLELHIRRRDGEGYPVVLTVDGSQESAVARLPATILDWVPSASPQEDGEALHALLFTAPDLLAAWSKAEGAHPSRRVRLRISRGAPELHAVPWELLREPAGDHPAVDLAVDPQTPFSRYLAGDWEPGTSVETKPIRVLVAVAAPGNLAKYNLAELSPQAEFDRLAQALAGSDRFELVRLREPCTLSALAKALEDDIHVLHFVGHGYHGAGDDATALVMVGAEGKAAFVRPEEISAVIQHHQHGRPAAARLRLVTLMSCQSARSGTGDAFRGLGPRLVAAGVPAVIAMGDDIAVDTADRFAAEFYARLSEHGLVDLAANQARHVVQTHGLPGHAIPILFMRLRDGRLFGTEPIFGLAPRTLKLAVAGALLLALALVVNLAWFAGPTIRGWFAPPRCHGNPLCVIVTGLAPPDDPRAQQLTQQIADEISLALQRRGTDDALVLVDDSLFTAGDDLSAVNVQARDDQARRLGQDEEALLVIWGNLIEEQELEHLQVNFELVDLLGVADAQGLRPFRAEPIKYDRVTERVICSNCLDVTAGEVGQRIDIIAHSAAGLLHYAEQTELAYDDFMAALYCAGEAVDPQLVQLLELDCVPAKELKNWSPGLLYYYAGKAATAGGDFATGIALLERAATENLIDPAAPIGIAAAYQTWLADPRAPQALDALHTAESRVDDLLLVTRIPADQADLHHDLGLVHELRQEWTAAAASYLEAADLYRTAAQLGDLDARSSYVSLVQAGHAQRMAGDVDPARATLAQAVDLDQAAPWAYLELAALAWYADEDRVVAEQWLDKAEQYASTAAYVPIVQGELCDAWNDLACAQVAYARALELRPVSGWLSSVVGDFYRRHADELDDGLIKAGEHYAAAVRLRPADPRVHERLAYVRAGQGEVDDAIRLFARAVELTFDDKPPQRLCDNLTALVEQSTVDLATIPAVCQ